MALGDNLKIEIASDSTKMRSDLALAESSLKSFRREQKALADQVRQMPGVPQLRQELDATTRSIQVSEREIAGLRTELGLTSAAANNTARSMGRLGGSFRNLSGGVRSLGTLFAGAQAGLAGFLAIKGFEAFKNQLDEVRKRLIEIRDISQQSLQDPARVKAGQDIASGLGRDAGDAQKILGGITDELAKVRTEAGRPINPEGVRVLRAGIDDTSSSVKVLRGGINDAKSSIQDGVRIFRGSSTATFDLSKAYEMLGINANQYGASAEGIAKKSDDVMRAFQRVSKQKIFDPVQLNEISKALFRGLPADAALRIIPGLLAESAAKAQKFKDISADIANEEARRGAVDRLQKLFDDQIAEHNRLWTSVETAGANAIATFISKTIPAWVAAWTQWRVDNKTAVETALSEIGQAFVDGWNSALKLVTDAVSGFWTSLQQQFTEGWNATLQLIGWDSLVSAATTAFNAIIAAAQATGRAIAAALNPSGAAPSTTGPVPGGELLPQFAGGGMIRGGGSGTSDSILARLSNGEFVMRAKAVQHWGPRFLAALNGLQNPYGGGGVVRGLPAYATGGLVTGGGATPVHLHIGGREFALSGNDSVVTNLVSHARQQQMRSSGRKPSWYGGVINS